MTDDKQIHIATPHAWQGFWVRQIGKSRWCAAAAWSWHSWSFGFEIIGPGNAEFGGLALVFGPLWLGTAKLKPTAPKGTGDGR